MLWINSSEYILNFKMDLGNGRELITLEPSETIEIPDKPFYIKAVQMEAPHLQPYELINNEELILQQVEIKPAPITDTKVSRRRGPKSKAN